MTDDELSALRAARREAWRAFIAAPTQETKAQYQAAQSTYTAARAQADDNTTRSWSGPPPDLSEELDEARRAANAAGRAMYADPSPETRTAWRAAANYYQNLRRELDPDFKARSAAANKKWRAKKKLAE